MIVIIVTILQFSSISVADDNNVENINQRVIDSEDRVKRAMHEIKFDIYARPVAKEYYSKRIIDRLSKLNHIKMKKLIEEVRKEAPKNFFDCLCKEDGGGAAPGVGVLYHPGKYGIAYSSFSSCPKDNFESPCVASGFGCWRFPLPRDKEIWNKCSESKKYDDNSTIIDAIVREIEALCAEKVKVESLARSKKNCEFALNFMTPYFLDFDSEGWMALCVGIPEGDTIFQYGNWYGPGFWGGYRHATRAGPKAPVDSLDEIAQRHDFGYVIASKYGKIYGKDIEYMLRGMADAIAVNDAMKLSSNPLDWEHRPVDIEKAKRYRARLITGFIMESKGYVAAAITEKAKDIMYNPFINYHDRKDRSQLPNVKKFKKEVNSHINGWKKNEAGNNPKFWKEDKKEQEEMIKKKTLQHAAEARERLPKSGQNDRPSGGIIQQQSEIQPKK